MSAYSRRLVLGLLILTLASALLAAGLLGFETGPKLWGALTGVLGVALSALLSYALMVQVLGASNLGFLRAHFAGMVLRIIALAILGLLVWGPLGWSTKHYLIAVGVSYPFFLALEAWQLSQRLAESRGRGSSERT